MNYWLGQLARLVIGGGFLTGLMILGEGHKAWVLLGVATVLYAVLGVKWLRQRRRKSIS